MYVESFNQIDPEAGFSILYAGEQACPPGHAYGGVRRHWMLHVVTSGRGHVKLGGAECDLGPGELFLVPPGMAHHYAADRADPWHYLWIGCSGGLSGMRFARIGLGVERLTARLDMVDATAAAIRALVAAFLAPRAGPDARSAAERAALSDAVFAALGAALARTAPPLPLPHLARPPRDAAAGGPSAALTGVVSDTVRQLLLFFDTNYHRPIGVAQAAEWVQLDRTWCAKIFREQTGTTMQDYLTATRMHEARLLLLGTGLPIKAVASSVGYADYPTFAKRFQAENGVSPGEFRTTPRTREPRGWPR